MYILQIEDRLNFLSNLLGKNPRASYMYLKHNKFKRYMYFIPLFRHQFFKTLDVL